MTSETDNRTSQRELRRAISEEGSGRRVGLVCLLLLLALAMALSLDIWMGEADVSRIITPAIVARILAHHIPLLGSRIALPVQTPYADTIIWQERVPRALSAALVGMLLAAVGAAFQSLLRNPLADPYTVGIASGAALGSLTVTLAGGAAWLGGTAPALAAFGSGLLAVGIVFAVARVDGRLSMQTFLLAGIIVGTFFWSLIPLFVTLGSSEGSNRQARIMASLFGSLDSMDWNHVLVLLVFGLLGGLSLIRFASELDIMAFGEETAAHLGVNAEALKRNVVGAGALMTAAAVAAAGIIGFIGFVTPHAARRLVGPGHRGLLPAAMLLGGLLLTLSDWLARVFLHDVPIGVVTALFGVPLFCLLLRGQLTGAGDRRG